MATEFDSGGGSKRRRTDEEEGEDAEEAEEDRITTLPEALRLHMLALLPLKSAIRTGALSTQWRALWTRRWPEPASLELRLDAGAQPLVESLERRGRRRLDRLSLSFHTGELTAKELRLCLAYAAACAVADLRVSSQGSKRILKLCLPAANPHLEHHAVFSLVAACPLLTTIDLRYCKGLCSGNFPAGANLKSVTVAECERLADVSISNPLGLRSFRYSGGYLRADQIPTTIDDLYLCFGGPDRRNSSGATTYDAGGRLCKLRRSCLDALIDICNLTVLTLCTSALRRVSAKARAKSIHGNAAVCKLQNLREVQLLVFAMFKENLVDIMDFLMTCCSPRLERLFVQLPTRSGQYKPEEEPSDSEEDGSEEDELEEEHECRMHAWEKHLCYGDESEEDQSEQDGSEEEGSEEDQLEQDESEEEGSEEDQSEQDESEEEGSEENHSVLDESEEDVLEEELLEGQASEKDLPEWEESGKDQSEEEGSEESVEEPLGDGCKNLIFLKMMNFMGRRNEMRLVSFVLKKSASLSQLILFTPSDHPKGHHKDHLVTTDFLETKLVPLEKASPNAQIILSELDATAVQPLHWETFVKV